MHSDYYITLVRWRDSSHLLVTWSTRLQNKTYVTICHAVSTDCHLVIPATYMRQFCSLSLSLSLSLCVCVYVRVCLCASDKLRFHLLCHDTSQHDKHDVSCQSSRDVTCCVVLCRACCEVICSKMADDKEAVVLRVKRYHVLLLFIISAHK